MIFVKMCYILLEVDKKLFVNLSIWRHRQRIDCYDFMGNKVTWQFFYFLKIVIVIAGNNECDHSVVNVDADTLFVEQGFHRVFNFCWTGSFSFDFDDVIWSSGLWNKSSILPKNSLE